MTTTRPTSTRKPNRRGLAAREQLLTTALRLLATGQPEAVSVNLVAKESGLSWGSVQNQFGDSDGFWAAVVDRIGDTANAEAWGQPSEPTVAGRLAEVGELYRNLLGSPYAVAVETIRMALPRPLDVLAQTHPHTATALAELDQRWGRAFLAFFEGLDVDEQRVLDVSTVLASAMRGLHTFQEFGTTVDVDRAHHALVSALTSYLEG